MRRGERTQLAGSEVDDTGTRIKHSEDEMISWMRATGRFELIVLFARSDAEEGGRRRRSRYGELALRQDSDELPLVGRTPFERACGTPRLTSKRRALLDACRPAEEQDPVRGRARNHAPSQLGLVAVHHDARR